MLGGDEMPKKLETDFVLDPNTILRSTVVAIAKLVPLGNTSLLHIESMVCGLSTSTVSSGNSDQYIVPAPEMTIHHLLLLQEKMMMMKTQRAGQIQHPSVAAPATQNDILPSCQVQTSS